MKTYLQKRLEYAKEMGHNAARAARYQRQIIRKGWCDADTWSLDVSLSRYILPQLKRLRETNSGHPCTMTDKQWLAIQDKMIRSFELTIEENDRYPSWFDKKDEETDKQWLTRIRKVEAEIHEGFKLFGEHFRSLWS